MVYQRNLTRSRNAVLAGVCGGIAQYFGLSIGGVRFITLLLILFGGLSLWVYIILWILLPLSPSRY